MILCGVSLLLSPFPVLATQSVVLAWNPSTDTNVVSYRIYYGTVSHAYVSQVTVGNTNTATISGLADGTTYYFAATSIDSTGDESPFSNEAVYTVPSAAAALTVLPSAAGQFSLSVSGGTGYQYVVQTSTNLINWVCVLTNTAPFTFTDTNAATLPQCFYRAFYLPPGNVATSTAATLTTLPAPAGQFSFSVAGISGGQYVVQSSTNLINWVSVLTNSAPFTFTDTNAAALPQCFYRTFYLPP